MDELVLIEAVRVIERGARVAEGALRRQLAIRLASEVATEYAEAMRAAPTSRVTPEGWGTTERAEGLSPRQDAAIRLVEKVLRDLRGEWNASILRHMAGSGLGPEAWRIVESSEVVSVDSEASAEIVDKRILLSTGGSVERSGDRVVAGFGAPLPACLASVGVSWGAFVEIAAKRVMVALRREIEGSSWGWPG